MAATVAWLEMQAPMVAASDSDTPASTNGVASAVRQVVHALATFEHGVTAAAKFCGAEMGQVGAAVGGDAVGGLGGGASGGGGMCAGGGDGCPHVASAVSDATLTPAMAATVAWLEMQAPMVAASDGETPASTNGVASAVRQAVHALATSEHGVTAAVKSCGADTRHVGAAGGGSGGGGGVVQAVRSAAVVEVAKT